MKVDEMQKLTVIRDGDKTKLRLGDNELQNVKEYLIASSTAGTVELTIKLIASFP